MRFLGESHPAGLSRCVRALNASACGHKASLKKAKRLVLTCTPYLLLTLRSETLLVPSENPAFSSSSSSLPEPRRPYVCSPFAMPIVVISSFQTGGDMGLLTCCCHNALITGRVARRHALPRGSRTSSGRNDICASSHLCGSPVNISDLTVPRGFGAYRRQLGFRRRKEAWNVTELDKRYLKAHNCQPAVTKLDHFWSRSF